MTVDQLGKTVDQVEKTIGNSRLHRWGLFEVSGLALGSRSWSSQEDVAGSMVQALEEGVYEVSRRRALAITNLLVTSGVPRGSIIAETASDAEPVFGTNTVRGVAANRRAEVFLDL